MVFLILFKHESITVFQSQLFKTTSTVIETEEGIIIVDPNWLPQEVQQIREYVGQIRGTKPLYLIFTHSDWDHIIGYGAFPDAIVIASEGFVNQRKKEQILEEIQQFDHEYYLDRDYPILYPKVDRIIKEDLQKVEIGKVTLTFYKAEGHTDDGLFTIIDPLGIWLAGDYLSDVEFPYMYSSSEKYEESLAKCDDIIERHSISMLIPGHGSVTEQVEEIRKRKRDSLHYIKELRKAILNNQNGEHLIESYAYPKGMKSFHEANIKLVQKELGMQT